MKLSDGNLEFAIDKLNIHDGDIVKLTCDTNNHSIKDFYKIMNRIKSYKDVEILLMPSDIKYETIDIENLQSIINSLIKLRNEHLKDWKDKYKKD